MTNQDCSCEDNRIVLIKNIETFEKQSYNEPDRDHNLRVNFPDGDQFLVCVGQRSKYIECLTCSNAISTAYNNAGEAVGKMVSHIHAWHTLASGSKENELSR